MKIEVKKGKWVSSLFDTYPIQNFKCFYQSTYTVHDMEKSPERFVLTKEIFTCVCLVIHDERLKKVMFLHIGIQNLNHFTVPSNETFTHYLQTIVDLHFGHRRLHITMIGGHANDNRNFMRTKLGNLGFYDYIRKSVDGLKNDMTYNVDYALYFSGVPKVHHNVTREDVMACYTSHQVFAFLVFDSKTMTITLIHEFMTDHFPEILLDNSLRNFEANILLGVCPIVHACDYCGVMSKNRCGRCKSSYYCGKGCQRKDWKATHKGKCSKSAKP